MSLGFADCRCFEPGFSAIEAASHVLVKILFPI